MGGPVKPGGSQRKKKPIHENGWNLCDRRRGLVGMREALDRRAGDQSAGAGDQSASYMCDIVKEQNSFV